MSVVVIDPQDREQIERFIRALDLTTGHRSESIPPVRLANFAAALREFARPTPPKPEEPTGLGAVVEDEDGLMWVRSADGQHGMGRNWLLLGSTNYQTYTDVNAVRILNDGHEVTR